ncbi:hypothetical protein HYC85_021260 [Camellia sinensis]|uniref:Uncharacterized protein n=1 Tax=Camellia sinensis TaxID=4442 RepID=A0A7J7GH60_CAMSI|nr:hypothetical protein HYC85_021260 [Camellia sinensis]
MEPINGKLKLEQKVNDPIEYWPRLVEMWEITVGPRHLAPSNCSNATQIHCHQHKLPQSNPIRSSSLSSSLHFEHDFSVAGCISIRAEKPDNSTYVWEPIYTQSNYLYPKHNCNNRQIELANEERSFWSNFYRARNKKWKWKWKQNFNRQKNCFHIYSYIVN